MLDARREALSRLPCTWASIFQKRSSISAGMPENIRKAGEARLAGQPLPRIGEPDEVAQAYLYLMKAGYTTGQILQVDGGSMLAG